MEEWTQYGIQGRNKTEKYEKEARIEGSKLLQLTADGDIIFSHTTGKEKIIEVRLIIKESPKEEETVTQII